MKKPSFKEIHVMLAILELARNALKGHRNFNLAEVHVQEYKQKLLPYKKTVKGLKQALDERDAELLEAVIESEIEHWRAEKIATLRGSILAKVPKKKVKKRSRKAAKKRIVKKRTVKKKTVKRK